MLKEFINKKFINIFREVIDFLVKAKPQLFNNQNPVFDGRKFLYTREPCLNNEKVILKINFLINFKFSFKN